MPEEQKPQSPPSSPTTTTPPKTTPSIDVAGRVDRALGAAPADTSQSRGGRPTNDERVQRAVRLVEDLTGKRVEIVDPKAPPRAVQVGDTVFDRDEYKDVQAEAEGSLRELFSGISELWAGWIKSDKVATSQKEAGFLAKLWNRALTFILKDVWLKVPPLLVAVVATVVWALPRFLLTLKLRRQAPSAGEPKK